jgi:mono/diheme cytochrome c family protein
MRSGNLRLVGALLAAIAFGAAGCGDGPGGGGQARTETGTQADPPGAAAAPNVGVSGGTAAGADTAGMPESTAATPPVNARPDSTPVTPRVDTSPARPRPPAQAAGRDTAAAKPTTTARAPARDTARPRDTAQSQDTASGSTSGSSGGTAAPAGGAGAGGASAGGGGRATPGKTVTQVEYTGWKQYEVNCARCHGEYGLGSTIAPSLYESFKSGAVDSAEYQRVVHGSRIAKGMPNWKGALSEEYLHAIYKYLSGRGAGRIAAGRPIPEG